MIHHEGHEGHDDYAGQRKLLRLGYESHLAEQYRAGRISLRDVACRLGLLLSAALDALQRLGISGNVTAADTLRSMASLRAG